MNSPLHGEYMEPIKGSTDFITFFQISASAGENKMFVL